MKLFSALFIVASLALANFPLCRSTEETASEETNESPSYVSPQPSGNFYFAEHFDKVADFEKRWVRSQAKKEGADEDIAKYDGQWAVESALKRPVEGDLGLVLKSKAKHAAISASLEKPFYFTDKPLIIQYEVTFQNGQDCGGAYLKLLTLDPGLKLSQFTDKSGYTIMFGPDKCGNDQKIHFIFRHKNPLNGTFSEKHAKKTTTKLDDYFKDGKPHLYTLMIHPDNTYYISVDYKIINQGTLLDDFSPPVNPPAEIDDPNDFKPEDWDEREKIPDPKAEKPEDWDETEPEKIPDPNAVKPSGWLEEEPEMIPDPSAEKPEDWDEDMDGTWEAPLIDNPACGSAPGCGLWKAPLVDNPKFKGKWRAPLVDNPNYKGKWHPRKIPNPDFFEDKHPFNMEPIGALGLELWSMSDNIYFDNFLITDDKRVAEEWAEATYDFKNKVISDQDSVVERLTKYAHDKPWLWAVYFLAVGIPAVLLLTYFCTTREQKEQIRAARAKKDDDDAAAATPDDKETAEPIEEKKEEEEELDEKEEEEEEKEETPEVHDTPVEEKQSPRKRRTRKD